MFRSRGAVLLLTSNGIFRSGKPRGFESHSSQSISLWCCVFLPGCFCETGRGGGGGEYLGDLTGCEGSSKVRFCMEVKEEAADLLALVSNSI